MATKTISITEEAYKRLANHRKKNESFSEIIIEITGKAKLKDLHGILSKEAADRLETNIKKFREEYNKSFTRRAEQIKKELS